MSIVSSLSRCQGVTNSGDVVGAIPTYRSVMSQVHSPYWFCSCVLPDVHSRRKANHFF